DLRIAGPEAHPHEHHRDASRPGRLGRTVRGGDDVRRAEALHDAVLEVHQEQDGAGTGHGRASRGGGNMFRPNLSDRPEGSRVRQAAGMWWARRKTVSQRSATSGSWVARMTAPPSAA